jgi:hypothetical protein
MENSEIANIFAAILLLFAVVGFSVTLQGKITLLPMLLLFSAIIIFVHVFSKKLIAYGLDSSVKHKIWHFQRYGLKPGWKFSKPVPFGLIVPLFFSVFSLGLFKVMTFLTYETSALKHRAAKRFGYYSYTEVTEFHNAVIGAAGIIGLLLLSLIAYFPGWETLSKLTAYYAFFNMIPISNLDGTQIFFGNRILWSVLAVITLIFTLYGLLLPA